jgi:hypothetical protein
MVRAHTHVYLSFPVLSVLHFEPLYVRSFYQSHADSSQETLKYQSNMTTKKILAKTHTHTDPRVFALASGLQ